MGFFSACGATEGPLFVALDASAPNDAQILTPPARAVHQGMRLQYQLQGSPDLHAAADLFVLDLFETPTSTIAALHADDRTVVAYVSAGSYEPWRPDVHSLPASDVGAPLERYPRESWLDVRTDAVRQLMTRRLSLATEKGFDGVLLASLDGYLSSASHGVTSAEQLDYSLWLASEARERGLAVGISSDWPQAAALARAYDFAIHTNCVVDRRCAELAPYRSLARAVFDLETRTDTSTGCAEAARLSVSVTFKHAAFDAWLAHCP